jgi:hypothetical protein
MAGQVAYHLLARAGMARAPWPVTTVVSCLPAGPGPGHGDRAGAHAAHRRRGRRCAGSRDRAASRAAAGVLVPAGPGRTRPRTTAGRGPVRGPGPGWSRPGTTARPRDHQAWPAARRTAVGSGPRSRPAAGRRGETGVPAGVARRRGDRLQPGAERMPRQRGGQYRSCAAAPARGCGAGAASLVDAFAGDAEPGGPADRPGRFQ